MLGISKMLSTDGFIMVNKHLIKILGLHEAVILGELCREFEYWSENGNLIEGSFYSTRENIEENTGLSEHLQRKAMDTLIQYNILSVVKRGMPAVNYYKIDFEELLQLFTPLTSCCQRREAQDVKGVNLNNNKQIKKNKEKNISKDISWMDSYNIEKPKKAEKKNLYQKCSECIDEYTNDPILNSLLHDYLTLRLQIKDKPIYGVNQWKGLLNKLDSLCKERDIPEEIVRYSIERGYASFFLPNNNYNNRNIKANSSESGVTSEHETEAEYNKRMELAKRREEAGEQSVF